MPNWCFNEMSIKGSGKEIENILDNARNEEENNDFSLEKLLPMPESEDKNNWYEWRLANWGTKWDLSDVTIQGDFNPESDEEVSICFSTAWSPPLEGIVSVSKKFPELSFSVFYSEPGADFCGKAEISDGCIDDKCVTYSEQFGCAIEVSLLEATNEDGQINCPVLITSVTDPYDMDSAVETIKWIATFPEDLEEDDVEAAYGDSLEFTLSNSENSHHDFYDKYYESEDKIKEVITDNLVQIKKAADYNKLNKEVTESVSPKTPRRKI